MFRIWEQCKIDDNRWSRDWSVIYWNLTCWGKVGWVLPEYTRRYGGFSSYTICIDENAEHRTIWLVSSDGFIEGEDWHLEVLKVAENCKDFIIPWK